LKFQKKCLLAFLVKGEREHWKAKKEGNVMRRNLLECAAVIRQGRQYRAALPL
jgi:hypothetical protein